MFDEYLDKNLDNMIINLYKDLKIWELIFHTLNYAL